MSAVNQHIAKERKAQEYLGLWFLPVADGQVRDSRAGVLHFQPDQRAEIDLLGSFEAEALSPQAEVFCRYPVVQGAAHGQKRFSLFDCVMCATQVDLFADPQLAQTQIHFTEGWVGPGVFKDKGAVRFFSYSFGLAGLASWHNVNAFSSQYDYDRRAAELKYMRPDDVLLYEDEQVLILLSYSWRPSGMGLAQTSGTIEHDPRIVIKGKNGALPFYGGKGSLDWYAQRTRTIIGLMMGNSCPMYEATGLYQKFSPETAESPLQCEQIYARLWCRDLKEEIQLSPYDSWIPYAVVKDDLPIVIRRFMSLADTPVNYAGHLVYLYSTRRGSYTQSVLPELVFQFEGIHREICGHRKWPLEKRLRDVINGLEGLFGPEDEDGLDCIVRYVKDRRNNYAHANPETYHANFRLYIFATLWMRMLDTVLVLYLCGLPVVSIKRGLEQNHEFKEMMAVLPALLRLNGGMNS